MGQDRNNNYRCDDEHLKKIAQLAEALGISKTQVSIRSIDVVYEDPDLIEEEDETKP